MHFPGLIQVKETISQRFMGNRDASHLGLLLAFVLQRFDQPVFAQSFTAEDFESKSPVTTMQSPESDTPSEGLTLADFSAQAPDLLPEEDGMQVADPGSMVFALIDSISGSHFTDFVKPMPRKANVAIEKQDLDNSLSFIESSAANTFYLGQLDDIVFGTEMDDLIYLGAGDDIVFSSKGNDTIILGEGNDTYVLVSSDHSTITSPDVIVDFKSQTNNEVRSAETTNSNNFNADVDSLTEKTTIGDKINLSQVESLRGDSLAVENFDTMDQALIYLMNNAFNNIVNLAFDRTTQVVAMDIDDNGLVDSGIKLLGVTELSESAFSLLSLDFSIA